MRRIQRINIVIKFFKLLKKNILMKKVEIQVPFNKNKNIKSNQIIIINLNKINLILKIDLFGMTISIVN